jgi:antitoxin component of MazEF toxin-antitoxin module
VVTPLEEDLSLDEMLDQVTDENRHGLLDWGPAVGKEVW